jgi:predicted metal-dependent phosphoesterase TrpH
MAAAGLRLAALTDHDALDGVRELRASGIVAGPSDAGPGLLAGVEINAVHEGDGAGEGELHILGYGMDLDDEAFEVTLARQRGGREVRVRETLERLRRLGMPVDDAFATVVAVADPASLGRPHVARALVATGHAASVEDAFARILGRGCPAFVPRRGLGPRQAIAAIQAAGGLAVLAHYREAAERVALVDRLIGWGLGGLEVHYGGMGRPYTAEETAALAAIARARGLVATGGSDYHGDTMSYAEAIARTVVPDEVEGPFLAALEAARSRR